MNIKPFKSFKQNESGSALVYILTAVVLFAALSFTVGNMMKGGGSDLDRERVQLEAVEIINYGNSIKQAIKDLKISNGCEDEELSFQSPRWDNATWYDNTISPNDNSCNIFDVSGGGVPWQMAPNGNDYMFSGNRYIDQVGTTGDNMAARAELYMAVEVSDKLCLALNNLSNIENPNGAPPDISATGASNYFTGSFDGGNLVVSLPDSASGYTATLGKTQFCGKQSNEINHFLQVLIAR